MNEMWSKVFQVIIRLVFLFAYGAFLWASIHHVATFFHNFEPSGTDWSGSYALAISIDATAVVLTIGVMFFRKNMPWYAQCFVWFFIVALTAFSWLVNWEYAQKYQSYELTTDKFWLMVNPILASSFAFLNLAYSLVAEFFNTRTETAAELEAKLALLEEKEAVQKKLDEYRERNKKPSAIQRAKSAILEVKEAANEVLKTEEKEDDPKDVNLPKDVPNTEPVVVDNQGDKEGDTETVTPLVTRPSLGMVEGIMYDRILEDQQVLKEVYAVAQNTDIDGLTQYLKQRFASHANYITVDRVSNVMQAIQNEHGELLQSLAREPQTGELTIPSEEISMDEQMDEEVESQREDEESVTFSQQGNEMDVVAEENELVTASVNVPSQGNENAPLTLRHREDYRDTNEVDQERDTDPEIKAMNVSKFPTEGDIDILSRRKPLTVKEAAMVLQCAEKTVRSLRAKGNLEAAKSDPKLITAASVRAVWQSRNKTA